MPDHADVELMAERFSKALDLWTGEPLVGDDREGWEAAQREAEQEVEDMTGE